MKKIKLGFTLIRTLRSKNLIRSYRGFTLIELMVVISIIGILAALSVVSFTTVQKQARDATRKSDLSLYRTSLQIYATKNKGMYPIISGNVDPSSDLCVPLKMTCNGPEDPKNSTDDSYYYQYQANTAGTEYVLWTMKMETSTNKWVVCSTGKSGIYSGTSALPPPSGTGTCPF